jgi:hypothetical protein
MRDSNVGKREISDFAKKLIMFSRFLRVRAAKEKKFLIGISGAQEIPAIDSCNIRQYSKQHMYSMALSFQ